MTRIDFPQKVRRSILKNLKHEIEVSSPERASDIVFRVIVHRKSFGFTDKEMDELKQHYKKKLEEVL